MMEKYPGPEDFDIAVSLFRLGGAYEAQSKHAEAEPLYKRVLVIVRQRLGPQNVAVVSVLTTTGDNYVAQKKFAEAERSYKEALEIQDKLATHDAATIANLLEKYAALLRETERGAEAAKFEARAEALRAKKTKGTVKEN